MQMWNMPNSKTDNINRGSQDMMEKIGYTGIIADKLMVLWQCNKCKSARIEAWIDGTPKCNKCKTRNKKNTKKEECQK